jgi:ribosomal protein S18 acetylase RimI-like enzyme
MSPSADDSPLVRAYQPRDYWDVSDVCLRTGEGGADATGLYVSDELLPDIYARPYLLFMPALAFVVEHAGRVGGYILCAPDTAAFVERYRAEWLPILARKYSPVARPSTPNERAVWSGFHPERMLFPELARYPAHLHIDLLPALQGRGLGRLLMNRLMRALRERGVPGLHLSLAPTNTRARGFYDHIGFREVPSSTPEAPWLGIELG